VDAVTVYERGALVTRVAPVHLAFFADLDAIADAKAELYEHLAPTAIAVVNADDPRMLARAQRLARSCVSFGRARASDVRLTGVRHAAPGLVVSLACGVDAWDVSLAALGLHQGENVTAALACCLALGLDVHRAGNALGDGFHPASHRLELVHRGDLRVLDDCYNANPIATRAALLTFAELFAATPATSRLVVLGSMHELGDTADALHADLGRFAASIAGTSPRVSIMPRAIP